MNKDEAVAMFVAVTGVEDEGIAFMLLEDCKWNLEDAVNSHLLMQSEPGPPTSNHTPGMAGSALNEGVYNSEQIHPRIWKVVEADPYGQYPFLYVILGKDKCIVIDTGTGCGDFKRFVSTHINTASLPYLVVCTHVHFDHVGGNHAFQGEGCLGIAMGSRDVKFTSNVEINSLSLAHPGCTIKPFEVTRWLHDGDLIHLDEANKAKEHSLEVIYTPGHTLDSIALIDHQAGRIFVGDTLYPFTAVHLDCLGSSTTDCLASLARLKGLAAGKILSCGHVECNLGPDALDEFAALVEGVRAGAVPPTIVEGEHAEFTNGMRFSVWMPLKERAGT